MKDLKVKLASVLITLLVIAPMLVIGVNAMLHIG